MAATVDVLTVGYVGDRVAGTVTLIRDGSSVLVVDPGMVASRGMILDPLERFGIDAGDVTDVILSHHHPDHTMNIALFPNAKVHDFMATYVADEWIDHEGDFAVTESVRLLPTPGHSGEDVSTLVTTETGLVVLTHLWWSSAGPLEDPFATSAEQLRISREAVVALEPSLIIPGHGAPFEVGPTLPI
jgi:glyoxylase-like metal-dependent hydrolase (beta-lactamase superfamily II)